MFDELVSDRVGLLWHGGCRRTMGHTDRDRKAIDAAPGQRTAELAGDPGGGGRVVEDDRADLHSTSAGQDDLESVDTCAYSADAHKRHVRQRRMHLPDAAQCERP